MIATWDEAGVCRGCPQPILSSFCVRTLASTNMCTDMAVDVYFYRAAAILRWRTRLEVRVLPCAEYRLWAQWARRVRDYRRSGLPGPTQAMPQPPCTMPAQAFAGVDVVLCARLADSHFSSVVVTNVGMSPEMLTRCVTLSASHVQHRVAHWLCWLWRPHLVQLDVVQVPWRMMIPSWQRRCTSYRFVRPGLTRKLTCKKNSLCS